LKGKVRHECERIARALIPNFEQCWPCHPPQPKDMCRGEPSTPDWQEAVCPICRIFGAPWHPAPITFTNLELTTTAGSPGPRGWDQLHSVRTTDLRTGVGINRRRGVAEERLLYATETYGPPLALLYRGRIWGTLEERREVALLLGGLRSITALGGARSQGLGWCQVEATVRLDNQPASVEELLQELDQWSR